MPTGLSSIQGGIYPPRKAHNYSSTHSSKCFLSVALETVPTRVWFTVALSDPFKEDHRVLPLSVSLLQAINSAADSKRTKENCLHSSIHKTTKGSECKKKNPDNSIQGQFTDQIIPKKARTRIQQRCHMHQQKALAILMHFCTISSDQIPDGILWHKWIIPVFVFVFFTHKIRWLH